MAARQNNQASANPCADPHQALLLWLDAFEAGERVLREAGMEYGSTETWWGSKKPRKQPHEGVDVVLADANQLRRRPLRPIESGTVVAVIDDFIGQTVVVQRSAHQFWMYGHIAPAANVVVGALLAQDSRVGGGEDAMIAPDRLGRVAESPTTCPSHLHVSLVESSLCMTPEKWAAISWATIHSVEHLRFVPITLGGGSQRTVPPPSTDAAPKGRRWLGAALACAMAILLVILWPQGTAPRDALTDILWPRDALTDVLLHERPNVPP